MPLKGRVIYTLLGALLTVFALYPTLKETFREQKYGLLLSPEDVKATCGKPQAEDFFKLIYVNGDHRAELQFMGVNHRMYLNDVKWSSTQGGVGEIRQVTRDNISDYVKHGWLPVCLEDAAK